MPRGRHHVSDHVPGIPFKTHPFAPILLLAVVMVIATLASQTGPRAMLAGETSWHTMEETVVQPLQVSYSYGSIAELHQSGQLRSRTGWHTTTAPYAAVGFTAHPVTFRLTLSNAANTPLQQWVTVPAPYIDRIRVARLDRDDGRLIPMRTQGSQRPFSSRLIPLPTFHWPVTIPPNGAVTLFFEVVDAGPTVLPVSVQNDDELVHDSVTRATINGTLLGLSLFLLAVNLFLVLRFRTVMLAWLTVLTVSVIHIQLVLNGFGAWLFWRGIPALDAVITTSMLTTLIALAQHTLAALPPPRVFRRLLNALSLAALGLLLVSFLDTLIPVQALTIILGALGCLLALVIALRRFRHSLYARYFTLAVLLLTGGLLASALRTVGILPVTVLTDAAFPLGTVMSAVVLLAAAVHFFWREQQLRRIADRDWAREQEQRIAMQARLEESLRTHTVTGRPNRAALEACLGDPGQTERQVVVLRLSRFHEIEHVVGHQLAEEFVRDYLTDLENHLRNLGPKSLIPVDGSLIVSIDIMDAAFVLGRENDQDDPFWQQLLDVVTADSRHQGYTFNWRCAIGVATFPRDGKSIQEVLSAAGYASLHQAPINFYDASVDEHQKHQQLLMLDLEDAFTSGQIRLAYQPKVVIDSGVTESVEALLRWHHPTFNLIPPGDWIPLVEELGSITRVTRWVLGRAAQDLDAIRARFGPDTRVAINISSRDLVIPGLAHELEAIVRDHGRGPEDFILEVTETGVIRNQEAAGSRLRQLRRRGFGIALDDFGTGTSSLSVLTEFALDEVKIDRSFLTGILTNTDRQKVFRATVALAQSLNLQTVVEGVEDEPTARWLARFPALRGQGYFWGQPALLENGQTGR